MTLLDARYKVLRRIGEGGFGVTYLAEDHRRPGNPLCVVKQLQRTISPTQIPIYLRLFEKEAETLEKLGEHPQIPRLLAYFEEQQDFYIVQEFIDGQTLEDKLEVVGKLPEAEVVDLLRQGLSILQFVHENRVIHRDIKPANLIQSQNGNLVLIDFGIVKDFSNALQSNSISSMQTRGISTTVSAGSAGYMPSEQLRGKPVPVSDLYALGMVAIQALTGRRPTDLDIDPDTADVIWRRGVKVSDGVADVLTKLVRHHYSRRYASAREALSALDAAVASPLPPRPVLAPKPTPDLKTRRRMLQALGLGALATGGVVIWGGQRWPQGGGGITPSLSPSRPPNPSLSRPPSLSPSRPPNPSPSRPPSPSPSRPPSPSPSPSVDVKVNNLDDFSWLSQRHVSELDLVGKTAWQLDLMRNSIFARHGRRFRNSELQAYFNQQSWYRPIYMPDEFPSQLLSSIEMRNAEFILEFQNRNGLR